MKLNLEWLKNNPKYLLFKVNYGSHVYGTNIETSDNDIRGVFILPLEYYFGNLEKQEIIKDEKNNEVYYEISKFCELLSKSNPTALEILFTPNEHIQYSSMFFEKIFLNERDLNPYNFLTKACYKPFVEYGKSQIVKAKGLDKKINWEKSRIERKSVLDFCFVPYKQGSIPVKEWINIMNKESFPFTENFNIKQEDCGLVKIPNMHDTYALFHTNPTWNNGNIPKLNGIVSDEETANDVCLSSIPDKNKNPIATLVFNKDAYSKHCKDYREYQDWLKNRNTDRYVDIQNHNQTVDGKNILHLVRLIDTCNDIIDKGTLVLKRENAKELLKIRRGEVDLQSIIDASEEKLEKIKEKFEKSDLKDNVDKEFIENLLLKIRQKFYLIDNQ